MKKDIVGYIGCILAGMGLFLPFLDLWIIETNFFEGDGKIVLIGLIICALFIFKKISIGALITSLICGGITIADLVNALIEVEFNPLVKVGIGAYFIGVGLILIIICSILQIKDKKHNNPTKNQEEVTNS